MKFKYVILSLYLAFYSILQAQENRPKVGLVLSGGGARGFAHIGVLKILDSLNFPVDYIAGTSIGGLIGGLYACGYSGKEIEQIVDKANWDELLSDTPRRAYIPFLQKHNDDKYQIQLGLKGITPVIPSGLIQGEKVSLLFSKLTFKDNIVYNFNNLDIEFRCVAVDLITGHEVILKSGSLSKAMRATMSIPTIFSPVEWGDSLLVDGGIINNFPADVVKDMGADIIIGVDIGNRLVDKSKLKSLISILNQTLVLIDYDRQIRNRKMCDMVLFPDLKNYTTTDFDNIKVPEIEKAGEDIALIKIRELQQLQERYNLYKKSGVKYGNVDSLNHNLIIHGIVIKGNKELPFRFIYRLLGLSPKDIFDENQLQRRISQLYGLGYFEQITYEIEKVDQTSVRVIIYVEEKPLRNLRIGIHYDNYYDIVVRLGLQSTNIPFAGMRLEPTLEFAGLFNFNFTASYPSRNLNLPVYPYLRFNFKDIPVNIYDTYMGDKLAQYSDRSYTLSTGLGILLSRSGNIAVDFNQEKINVDPIVAGLDSSYSMTFNDRLRALKVRTLIDMLDDPILPRKGIYLDAEANASFLKLGSDKEFQQYKMNIRMYHTLFKKHTIKFQGFYTNFNGDLPIYKYVYQGGPSSFVGISNDQLFGDKFAFVRMDYRYEYKKDIFLKLMVNTASYNLFDMIGIDRNNNLYGYGIGVKFLSILGPLEIMVSQGSKSLNISDVFQTRFYLTAGYIL